MVHHMTWEGNGTALNICEIKVRDIMPEKFIELLRVQHEIIHEMNTKIKIQTIDTDGDFKITHQRYEMPFMIANRSFFNTYYHIDGCEPGEFQYIASGVGNEKFIKKHERLASRDVIGCIHLNYIGVRPIRNSDFEVIGSFL